MENEENKTPEDGQKPSSEETKTPEEVKIELPAETEAKADSIEEAADKLTETLVEVKMMEITSLGEALATITTLAQELKEIVLEARSNLEEIKILKTEIEQATLQTAEIVTEIAEEVRDEVKEETTETKTEILPEVKSNPSQKTGLRMFLG